MAGRSRQGSSPRDPGRTLRHRDPEDPPRLRGVQLEAFNLYDQDERRFLPNQEAATLLASIGIPMVGTLESDDVFSHDQVSLPALAEYLYPGTKNEREGIVIRPQTESPCTAIGGRLSFKASSNRFLFNGGD